MEESKKDWQLVQTDERNNEEYNTYIIPRDEIKNKEILATGWKMLNYDYTTMYSSYKYEEGKIYSVDKDIELCQNGLHFCENPIDCLMYGYGLESNFLIAKVNAYDDIEEDFHHIKRKTVAQTLEIVKIYNWNDFYEIAIKYDKKYSKNNKGSYENEICKEIKGSYDNIFCVDSLGINESKIVGCSKGIYKSNGVYLGNGISNSKNLFYCDGVDNGQNMVITNGTSNSGNIHSSSGLYLSDTVCDSSGICNSIGIIESHGIYNSAMVLNCNGLSNSLFCDNISGEYKIFNKQVSKERMESLMLLRRDINLDILSIEFNVITKNEASLCCNDFKLSRGVVKKIKELPEYDEKIYNKIMRKIRTSFPKYKTTKEEV